MAKKPPKKVRELRKAQRRAKATTQVARGATEDVNQAIQAVRDGGMWGTVEMRTSVPTLPNEVTDRLTGEMYARFPEMAKYRLGKNVHWIWINGGKAACGAPNHVDGPRAWASHLPPRDNGHTRMPELVTCPDCWRSILDRALDNIDWLKLIENTPKEQRERFLVLMDARMEAGGDPLLERVMRFLMLRR